MLQTGHIHALMRATGVAPPQIRDEVKTVSNTSVSSLVVNLPTLQAGDLLIVFFILNNNGIPTNAAWNQWSSSGTASPFSNSFNSFIFYKTATGSEGATETFTTIKSEAFTAYALSISNWRLSPIVPRYFAGNVVGGNTVISSSVTSPVSQSLLLSVGMTSGVFGTSFSTSGVTLLDSKLDGSVSTSALGSALFNVAGTQSISITINGSSLTTNGGVNVLIPSAQTVDPPLPTLISTTIQSTTFPSSGTVGVTADINMPVSGIQVGDTLLILLTSDINSSGTCWSATTGWTLGLNPGQNGCMGVYSRTADGTENGTTVSLNFGKRAAGDTGNVEGLVVVIRNGTLETIGAIATGSAGNPATVPSVVPNKPYSMILAWGTNQGNNPVNFTPTASNPYTYTSPVADTNNKSPGWGFAYAPVVDSSSVGTVTAFPTSATGFTTGVQLVIAPTSF